ncbi:Rv2993c-like domain-containing protein, partial [Streptomyces roseolus]|uniref:DUF2437 domain-containing protein n=1 Tax=Streptomyces roseolus TaxID=67358 RepID=UPI0036496422
MRIARFSIDGNVAFGAVEGEGTVESGGLVLDIIKGIPYTDFELSGTKVPLVRTALFNWAFARHNQGAMVFRIEDTDAARDS